MKRVLKLSLILLLATGTTTNASFFGLFQRGGPKVHKSLKVNAGPDQTITLPAIAYLAGTYTVVPAGTTIFVTWSKSNGPGTVTFSDSHALSTTAAFSIDGTYTLLLRGTSNSGLKSNDTIGVTANPAAPAPPPPPPPPPPPQPPPPPAPSPVNFAWNANTEGNLAGYNLYRSTTSGVFSTRLNGGVPIVGTTYTDSTVQTGNTYYYVLRAVNSLGQESANSTQVSASR